VAALNFLPKIVPASERALFVSIHSASTACLGGLSPIAWGLFLKTTSSTGQPGVDAGVFQVFFVTTIVSACILSALVARLPEDTKTPVEPLIIGNAILRPFRAATYLMNLIDLPLESRGKTASTPKPAEAGTASKEQPRP
jgi:hypothetical protein